MKKYLNILRVAIFLGLMFVTIYAHDSYVDDKKFQHNPVNITSYDISGTYQINPETIIDRLSEGETDIFLPLEEDPSTIEELSDINISWTQGDFLQIADALSGLVWGQPLDPAEWKIYSFQFRRGCTSTGFDYAEFTYYKSYKSGWRQGYTTRYLEIDPYSGLTIWGDKEFYPQPILFNHWNSFDLIGSDITADDAIRIADENGGKVARLQEENNCYVILRVPADVVGNDDLWRVDYISNRLFFEIYINSYTGELSHPRP